MDKLTEMLTAQLELQQRLGFDFEAMTTEEKTAYIKEYSGFVGDELYEMQRELPYYKPWRKYSNDRELVAVQYDKARKEFADAIHFVLNIALALGLSADDIYKLYCDKNAINHQRQENTTEYKPCVDRTE